MKIDWFYKQKRKEHRERKEILRQAREQQTKDKYKGIIDKATLEMTQHHCALRAGFGNCSIDCIHFKHGEVYYDHHFSVDTGVHSFLSYKLPKCKLWK